MFRNKDIIRFLQANGYKPKTAVKDLQQNIEWRVEHLPIILTDIQKELLDNGYLYTHGRDKFFRPLVVHNPKVYKTFKPEVDEALNA